MRRSTRTQHQRLTHHGQKLRRNHRGDAPHVLNAPRGKPRGIIPYQIPFGLSERLANPVASHGECARHVFNGLTSVALIVVAFIGLTIFIERLIVLRAGNFLPRKLSGQLMRLTQRNDFVGIGRVSRKSNSALGQVANYIASHTHIPFEILSFGVTDMIARTVSRQHQRTYPLAVIATISPLLGLLGTIIGMIEAFQKVALMGDTGDASVLADSIGKALITTALGLVIAIPALACFHFFKSRVNSYGIRLEEAVDQLMAPWLHPENQDKATTESETSAD